jgi:hypothetical protein
MNESSMKFMRSPKAVSDRGFDFKDGEDLCDFDDIDQLYNKFVPLESIIRDHGQLKPEETKSGHSPHLQHKLTPGINSQSFRHHFLLNNINSSLLL